MSVCSSSESIWSAHLLLLFKSVFAHTSSVWDISLRRRFGRLLLSRFVCNDAGNVWKSRKKSRPGLGPASRFMGTRIGSKVWHMPKACNFRDTVKTQDSDVMGVIDAKHCKTYQIFSNSRCFRQVEISFERNFEPADWTRFKLCSTQTLWRVWHIDCLKMHGFVQTCDTSHQFMELGGFASRFWSRHAGRWPTNFKKMLVNLWEPVAREDGNLEQHPQVPSNRWFLWGLIPCCQLALKQQLWCSPSKKRQFSKRLNYLTNNARIHIFFCR